ncbi:retinoblastoma-related protein-like isoform X2 [Mercurialis annua]|uniref:retinoblastoma-related protein-like isoform X2 n=1 Tax=Mercurialis annua TaxID=3986 RepID=UPI00215E8629|nr:retinoblastoma-related protein-like isoform X2 [Mercurialis annua]
MDKNSSQATPDIRVMKRKIDETESIEDAFRLLQSPSGSNVTTPTPMKRARNTRTWLQTVISPLPSDPSSELQDLLVIRDTSIVNEVIRRANIVLSALFPTSRLAEQRVLTTLQDLNLMESLWSEQRRSEAIKLYYKVLESICQSETEKSKPSDLSGLLGNERFHRCLLSCSAELVSAADTGNGMLLSMLFERTGITAFDLCKVIQSLIIYEPSLPRELRRHLNSLEEQLLEMRVWEKGSSLYSSLIVAKPDLSEEIRRLQLLGEPIPSLEAISWRNPVYSGGLVYSTVLQKQSVSPAQDRVSMSSSSACAEQDDMEIDQNSSNYPPTPTSVSSLKKAFTSPAQSKAPAECACSNTSITVLFRKMEKLAAIRIQNIAERLNLSQQLRNKVYILFQRILNRRTELFFNRQTYQILICCFYVLAKMSGINLSLKQILDTYMKQLQFRYQVLCSVSGNQEKNRGQFPELVTLYNKIFLPSAKSFLDEIHNAEPQTEDSDIKNTDDRTPTSNEMSSFRNLPDMSPRKISPTHNVYVSPVRLSKDDFSSNMSRSYYAIVGKSIYPYETPSTQLVTINQRLKRNKKVRCRLNFDNADVAMISDDVVVKSLFTQ